MIIDLEKEKISLTEAIQKAQPYDTIYLDSCTYREKITISTPYLKLIGREESKISYDAAHGTIVPVEMGGDGVRVFGTSGSASFLVTKEAVGFQATHITFENAFRRAGKPNGQAVAFKSECSKLRIQDCRFIGEQDTLYLDIGKDNLIEDSYIEGDVDFVFGSADCVFQNCTLLAKNVCGKAYFLAPDTYQDHEEGFVFKNCKFLVEEGVEAYLGRAWFPSKALLPVYPRVTLFNCELDPSIVLDLIEMHAGDPRTYSLSIHDKE